MLKKKVSAVLFKWNLLMKSLFVYPPLLIFCPVTWQSAYRERSGLVRWQTSIPEAFPDEDGSDESVMTPPGEFLAAAKQQRFLLSDKLDTIHSDISRCFQSQTRASAKSIQRCGNLFVFLSGAFFWKKSKALKKTWKHLPQPQQRPP